MSTDEGPRARVKRLKRMATRRGLRLIKPWAISRKPPHFGTYALIVPVRNALELADPESGHGMSLDAIEEYLTRIGRASGEPERGARTKLRTRVSIRRMLHA
jgi:hypothetical protein